MSDIVTLCIIGIIVIVGIFFLMRMMGAAGGNSGTGPYAQRGENEPTYDDPDIESSGGFGANRNDPDYDGSSGGSVGGFSSGGRKGGFSGGGNESSKGSSGGGFSGGGTRSGGGSSSPRNDSPSIRSRGGFGRNKK